VMIGDKTCELREMPEIIARKPNGPGITRDKVLEVALNSMQNRLSELRHDDAEKMRLMVTEPHLSYAEGVIKLKKVVEEYNRCTQGSTPQTPCSVTHSA